MFTDKYYDAAQMIIVKKMTVNLMPASLPLTWKRSWQDLTAVRKLAFRTERQASFMWKVILTGVLMVILRQRLAIDPVHWLFKIC